MPANVVAAASEQRIPGVVLGWNVVVRFVPADFRFEYGDGSSARTATGGATWPQLGQAQFTPTATSHVYRSRGTYPVAVTVRYTASVDFGTGFRPVDGYVSATTAGTTCGLWRSAPPSSTRPAPKIPTVPAADRSAPRPCQALKPGVSSDAVGASITPRIAGAKTIRAPVETPRPADDLAPTRVLQSALGAAETHGDLSRRPARLVPQPAADGPPPRPSSPRARERTRATPASGSSSRP